MISDIDSGRRRTTQTCPGGDSGCRQVNRAKSKAVLLCRIQAIAVAQAASASARKRRRLGLLIKWRWMLKVL